MKAATFFAIAFLISINIFGFSVKNHKHIICLTQQDFCKLLPNNNITPKVWKAYKEGNIYEDDNKSQKRVNWHFYDPTFTFHHEESLNRRFKSLIEQLKKQIDKNYDVTEIYKTLGGITHYLQDVAVPPHVVPVYHGMFDAFDGYKLSNKDSFVIDLEMVVEKSKLDTSFYDLLNEYAQLTLNSIKDSITITEDGINKNITWNWFWDASSTIGLGYYGRLKNNFGNTGFSVKQAWYVRKRKYKVSENYYFNFHKKRVRAAKEASLRALLLLDKMLKKRDS